MAGSLRAFVYTDDRANRWAVRLDESNAEVAEFGFESPGAGDADLVPLPSSIKMRYCLLRDRGGSDARKKMPIGSVAAMNALTSGSIFPLPILSGNTSATIDFVPTYLSGEVRKLLFLGDTGLNDGDVEEAPETSLKKQNTPIPTK